MSDATKLYKDRSAWMRGLYMVIFMFFLGVAKFVTFVVVIVQFIKVLFSADTNQKLVSFGESLSQYQYQILMFLTYNTEQHPYPMSDWPVATETAPSVAEASETAESSEPAKTTEAAAASEQTATQSEADTNDKIEK